MIENNTFIKSKYFYLFIIVSLSLLFIEQTGTDFLYYYLPTGEYLLENLSFPKQLAPSYIDSPMAYPPIEFIFIGLFKFLLNDFGIKVYYILKIFVFFILFFELSKFSKNKKIFDLFLLIPSFLMFSTIFNTDLNIVISILSILLFLQNEKKYKLVLIFGVSFGLLSKYTFWPIYFFVLCYLFLKKKNWKPFFFTSLVILPFLIKNYYLYNNPIFPIFDGIFNKNFEIEQNLIPKWGVSANDMSSYSVIFESLILISLANFRKKISILFMYVFGGLYCFYLVNHDLTSARFFFPISLFLIYYLSNNKLNKINTAIILLSCVAVLIFYTDKHQEKLLMLTIPAYMTLLFINPKYLSKFILIVFLTISSAKSFYKFNFFSTYSYKDYEKQISKIENNLSKDNIVVTDFKILPYHLRNNENVIVIFSYLNPKIKLLIQGDLKNDLTFFLNSDAKIIKYFKTKYPNEKYLLY